MVEHLEKPLRNGGPPKPRRLPAKAPGVPKGAAPPIVIAGIGASAGGVEALGRFFDALPADSGAAFVVVLHLDPTRESQMAHVLGTHTAMPVVQVKDGMRIEPGRVYVIAPDRDLTVRGGGLHLVEPAEPRGHRHPVDVLFRSLAADQGERSIAIVLSGTGSNGTDGLKDVKAAGGLVLVQDPATAKFDGMPRSAIAAGMADHILAPEAMPEVLVRYLHHGYIAAAEVSDTGSAKAQPIIDQILALLRARGGHDFGNYKRSTLERRIQRRLGLRNMAALADYLNELRANPDELAHLVKDLMINVTGFFRDEEAWKILADQVIAPMVAARDTGASIRAWVPGCSSGEEAYSLAMLISEQATAAGKQFDVKIFATDTREDNLSTARDGVYPQAAMANVEPGRLRRFFDKLDDTCRVKKELRGMIVLAPHNLLRDPPFSRLDLVSCRNLLIYLEPEAQSRIIALCHFALREGGHLLLGNSETVGRHEALFETVSKKWRIYRRLGPTRHDIVSFPVLGEPAYPRKAAGKAPAPAGESLASAAEMARRALLERFAPASVLIDRNCRVLYFHGATGDYLEQPTGEPSRDLFVMAREGLGAKLRAAVHQAIAETRGVTVTARIRYNKTNRTVAVTVAPLPAGPQGGGNFLVSFEPELAAASGGEGAPEALAGEHALQDELKAARRELQITTELMDSTNEEMKASNEEITSMNEELQSTNEELETSKEELQSFNEELHTVNNQLQHKIRELEDSTNDLNNLLAGTETATLFLDTNLCVTWFTPATQALFNFVASDIGRPIGHFARKFADENLLSDAETVLRKLTTIEAEVPSDAGRWYLRRMLPYHTLDNRIAGVVVVFTDETERKRASDAVDEARIYAQAIVETIRQPLLVLDGALRVVSANTAFQVLFEISQAEAHGRLVYDLGNGQWDIPQLRSLLGELLAKDRRFSDVEIEHEIRGIGHRSMLLNGRKLLREGGRDALILLAIEDITRRKRGEAAIRASEAQYRTLFNSIDEGFCIIEKIESGPGEPIDFRYLEANPAFERQTGVSDVVGKTIRTAFPGEPQEWINTYDAILRDGEPIRFERGLVTKGRVLELYAFRLEDVEHRRLSVIFQDITGRKRAEEIAQRLAAIIKSSDDAIISTDIDGVITSWNRGAELLFGYSAGEVTGKLVTILVPPDRQGEEPGILERIRKGQHVDHSETVRLRKDGSQVWVSLSVSPLKDAGGDIIGASKIIRDMTERRLADEHREILVGELNHRVKNTLAMVNAIASQTLRGAASIEDARLAFESRLLAVARGHDLLTHDNWAGSDLESVAKATFEPHGGGKNRFHIEGPFVPLTPAVALTFTMALHELCTNAAKYGALSTPKGHVDITWQVTGSGEGGRLQLRWAESGGPPVVHPTRRGFGSRLVEKALAMELGGQVRIDYDPAGVVCTIDAPLPSGKARMEPVDARRDG